jgi:hypothetical protein
MKAPHFAALERGVTQLQRSAVVLSIVSLFGGCSRVNVMPLGSTSAGRQQFEITCNELATDTGSCHEEARDACAGDYETLDVDYIGSRATSNNGQFFTTPGSRVLLIACNR